MCTIKCNSSDLQSQQCSVLIDGQRDINLPICIIKVVVCTKLRAVYNILSIEYMTSIINILSLSISRFITFSDSVNKSGSVIDFVCVTVPS